MTATPPAAAPRATTTAGPPQEPVVRVDNLQVSFPAARGWRTVVRGVSLSVAPGERVAVVGESGSGKTMLGLSLMGITPESARVEGEVRVDGVDVATCGERELRRLRGGQISMVFQDPLTSLNPVRTIGSQLVESVRRHAGCDRATARRRVVETLTAVGVPSPEERLRVYPHQLSGGLRQRVVIALALVNRPRVLVADEPTTALDATIQAQILDVLRSGIDDTALLLITHDLAVAAEVCDRLVVVYAGRIVEQGRLADVVRSPRHPYTRGLLAAVPQFDPSRPTLVPIPGTPPPRPDAMAGCRFAPRCPYAQDRCRTEEPDATSGDGAACWYPREEVTS